VGQLSERAAAPVMRTSFFGRERERAHLSELMRRGPLATVTGVGGVGKTRLVAEVLTTEAAPDRVRWCALTALADDAEVAPAVADALGRSSASAGPERAVVEAMQELGLLLVLDNCEQVVLGAAGLVEEILATCPDARVVATSREPLGLEGEAVLALGPLPLPEGEDPEALERSEAVALFLDRARLAYWDFALDADNAQAVARICRRLDGLPLALELAAARVRSLSPAEISDRLDSRFALLARPRSRGAERHRTLRAAIDWSYRLLDEPEQLVFERLSVLSGRCDLDAAVAICAGDGVEEDEMLDLLDRLVERSLLRWDEREGITRYGMLETLRHYARDRLVARGDEGRRRSRHADHFADVADRFRRDAEQTWSARMLSEGIAIFGEVRAAARWSMRDEPVRERALRMLAPLWALAHTRHSSEILELCDEALEAWPIEHDALGQALLGTAAVAGFVAGRPLPATERARAAIAAEADGAPPAVIGRRAIALVTYGFLGAVVAGLERLDEVIAAARECGVRTVELEMSVLRAQALAAAGRPDEALNEAEAARAAAERLDSPYMLAWSLYILGTVLAARTDERAEHVLAEALRWSREGGFHLVIGASLRQLGRLAVRDGREAEAGARLAEALEHFTRTGDTSQAWDVLRSAAPLFLRRGHAEQAAQALAGADADPRARRPAPLEAAAVEALRGELRTQLERAAAAPPRLDELGPALLEALRAIASADVQADAAEPAAGAGAVNRAPRSPVAQERVFRREGELWTLAFDGQTVHMPDLKGLHDLARLLAAPGEELHCLELAGAPAGEGRRAGGDGHGVPPGGLGLQGDAGELLDERGRREYRRRLHELRDEAERAEAANDTVRAERARDELDALTEALASAFGLGGRPRRAGDPAERARSAVTWRVRSALNKIEEAHPALGRHLSNSVRTGAFCVYRPERPVSWTT
jgi:predicted ATPase